MAAKPFFRRVRSAPFSGRQATRPIDYKDTRLLQRYISERANRSFRNQPAVLRESSVHGPCHQTPPVPRLGLP